MVFKDYYKILGLENNRVSQEEIRVAFREQAKKYHPDVNNVTEERFKDINEAYKVLSGSQSKRKYDRMWNNYVGKKIAKEVSDKNSQDQGSISGNFFNMFFGISNKKETQEHRENKKKKLAVKGENIDTEVSVDLEEAFYGSEKKIALRTVNRKNENIYCKNSSRNQKWRKG